MNVKEIVIKYLKENGYDGLCADECGCGIDSLITCDSNPEWCCPAYAQRNEDDELVYGPEKPK